MKIIITVLLIIVGIIHVLPLSGMMGADRLLMLYGVDIVDANLELLMRHRAVLFGLLGGFIIYAAFKPAFQLLAIMAGFVSVVSFLVIAQLTGEYNESIQHVVMADIVALVLLFVASILYFMVRSNISSNEKSNGH